MPEDNTISRRKTMKLAGAVAATAVVAGCADDDDDNGNGDDEEESFEIAPGERIVFYADASAWEGEEPSEIETADNPTLVLTEGEDYEIGWEEGDGTEHNIEIVDDDDDVVDDYSTDNDTEGGDDQFLDFTATDEMAEYVCRPHATAMRGAFEIEEGDEMDDDENGDDENGDDENGDDE